MKTMHAEDTLSATRSGAIRESPQRALALSGPSPALGSDEPLGLVPGWSPAPSSTRSPGRRQHFLGIAGLLGLLVLLAAGRSASADPGYVEIVLRFMMSAIVRRNLLRHILARPGALALPLSLGETLSRFRDDAYAAEDNIDWSADHSARGSLALVGIG